MKEKPFTKKILDTNGDYDKVKDMDNLIGLLNLIKYGVKKRICKVCYKMFDPTVGWQLLSHTHQGQGPNDDKRGGND